MAATNNHTSRTAGGRFAASTPSVPTPGPPQDPISTLEAEISALSHSLISTGPASGDEADSVEAAAPAAGTLPLSPTLAMRALLAQQAQRIAELEHAATSNPSISSHAAHADSETVEISPELVLPSSGAHGAPPTTSAAAAPSPALDPTLDPAAHALLTARLDESDRALRVAQEALAVARAQAEAAPAPAAVEVPAVVAAMSLEPIKGSFSGAGAYPKYNPDREQSSATETVSLEAFGRSCKSCTGLAASSNSSEQNAVLLFRYGVSHGVQELFESKGLTVAATRSVPALLAALAAEYPDHLAPINRCRDYLALAAEFKSGTKLSTDEALRREQSAYHAVTLTANRDFHAVRHAATLVSVKFGLDIEAVAACLAAGPARVVPDAMRKAVVFAGLQQKYRPEALRRAGASEVPFADFVVAVRTHARELHTAQP
jgi:hypothetical protein